MVVSLVFNICILMLGGLYGNCLTGWTISDFLVLSKYYVFNNMILKTFQFNLKQKFEQIKCL